MMAAVQFLGPTYTVEGKNPSSCSLTSTATHTPIHISLKLFKIQAFLMFNLFLMPDMLKASVLEAITEGSQVRSQPELHRPYRRQKQP